MNKKTTKKLSKKLEKVRRLLADYMYSEGCDCCRDIEAHRATKRELAKLLDVPECGAGTGYYDFDPFRTPKDAK